MWVKSYWIINIKQLLVTIQNCCFIISFTSIFIGNSRNCELWINRLISHINFPRSHSFFFCFFLMCLTLDHIMPCDLNSFFSSFGIHIEYQTSNLMPLINWFGFFLNFLIAKKRKWKKKKINLCGMESHQSKLNVLHALFLKIIKLWP